MVRNVHLLDVSKVCVRSTRQPKTGDSKYTIDPWIEEYDRMSSFVYQVGGNYSSMESQEYPRCSPVEVPEPLRESSGDILGFPWTSNCLLLGTRSCSCDHIPRSMGQSCIWNRQSLVGGYSVRRLYSRQANAHCAPQGSRGCGGIRLSMILSASECMISAGLQCYTTVLQYPLLS